MSESTADFEGEGEFDDERIGAAACMPDTLVVGGGPSAKGVDGSAEGVGGEAEGVVGGVEGEGGGSWEGDKTGNRKLECTY